MRVKFVRKHAPVCHSVGVGEHSVADLSSIRNLPKSAAFKQSYLLLWDFKYRYISIDVHPPTCFSTNSSPARCFHYHPVAALKFQ